jgi:hypothetical protein
VPANATTPNTDGKMVLEDYSYKGVGAANTPLCVRPIAPNSTSTELCLVPYFSSATSITYSAAGASEICEVVVTAPVAGFDASQFNSPVGSFAIVGSDGKVLDIVTYEDFTVTLATGIKFFGCKSLTGRTAITSNPAYLYPLSTANLNNLPIYPISTDSDANPLVTGFSLLPTYYTYPSQLFMGIPVGSVGTLAWNVGGSGRISCMPTFIGLLWKAAGDLLDQVAQDIVKDMNAAHTAVFTPYFRYDGVPGQFTIVASKVVDPNASERGIAFWAFKGTFGVTDSTPGIRFDQPVPLPRDPESSFSDQELTKNILVLSKANRIENIPYSQILSPTKIGLDTQRLQRVSVNNDQLYCFKENEGIYRVEVVAGPSVPQIAAIGVVDNTTWLTGDQTLQEIGESIYFLSNRGAIQLNNGQITVVSQGIESDLKNIVASEVLANIRSFGNNLRRQYGLYFPTANKTYVLDLVTGQWSKWGMKIDQSVAYPDGRLLTAEITTGYNTAGVPDTRSSIILRRDIYSFGQGWDAPVDQYDLTITKFTVSPLAGSTISFTYKTPDGNYLDNLASLHNQYPLATTKCYYRTQAGELYPLTFVSAVDVFGRLTFTFDNGATPTAVAGGVGQSALIIGVNTSATFNRFFTSPNSLMQFTECQVQSFGAYTNPVITFEADVANPTFSSVNSVTIPTTYDIIRVQVPRNQARGRWCQVKIDHTYPFEKFVMGGLSWVYRDQNTFKVKIRSTP